MFDNTCKYLAATYPADLAAWLLGEPVPLVEVQPQELALDPIRADSLILLQAEKLLLHVEFQTQPDPDMPLRMLDYWLRARRKFPRVTIRQVVLYLRPTTSAKVFENQFTSETTAHRYEVRRLWEQEPSALWGRMGTLPLAILAGQGDKENLLREIAQRLAGLSERGEVATATYILAGLVMEDNAVERILRREVMRESVTYQQILAEGIEQGIYTGWQQGKQEGLQVGRQEGRQEGEVQLLRRQLTRRFGELSDRQRECITSLSLEQLEALGEALLDFQSLDDFETWLGDRA